MTANQAIEPRDRIIVALDTPSVDEARGLVRQLEGSVSFFKIGLELAMQGGLSFADELVGRGHRVFLDMKFLDIGNTVERAVANVAKTGVSFLTIHGTDRKTMKAAAAGAAGSPLRLLAVTVLTNLSADDLTDQGISGFSPEELVVHRTRLAKEAGLAGVIASGQEAANVRQAAGDDFLIVTPGIRLPSDDAGDQARVTTPAQAIGDGADYLVVGRPITRAADVGAAAQAIADDISRA